MAYLTSLFFLFSLTLVLVLVGVSLDLYRKQEPARDPSWGFGTRYFLVLLRLAIGWHFLVEGIDKWNSPAWSSEAYLRESTGPLAPLFRSLAGDSLLDRLAVADDNQFPLALEADWNSYYGAFRNHFALDDEQAKRAAANLEQSKARTWSWLTTETKVVSRPMPQGPSLSAPMTIPQRLQDLEKKELELRSLEENFRATFGPQVFAKMREARAEVKRIRSELQADLGQQTVLMRKALLDILDAEQKEGPPLPEGVARPFSPWSLLDWADGVVKFGLLAVGVGLLLGLCTRTACVGGACFLFLFFLAMPPLPGWPENPRAEGHYLYINKNIIEMLALLALATTRSGRWAGLDGALQFFLPACCGRPPALEGPRQDDLPGTLLNESGPAPSAAAREVAPENRPASSLVSKEFNHGP